MKSPREVIDLEATEKIRKIMIIIKKVEISKKRNLMKNKKVSKLLITIITTTTIITTVITTIKEEEEEEKVEVEDGIKMKIIVEEMSKEIIINPIEIIIMTIKMIMKKKNQKNKYPKSSKES